ncbi:hypothetical protein BZG36_03255 [Bifiguratus adelaidae]|uniref:Ion transport domain-containing protein n=1 Tax=Bifiguratus adelaidae TaxID=1938954 RepID=A0A261Y030_9FUNG|nr:hypothetical protein BZG36_03255 [Bifiguratus adelaidae]
MSTAKHAGHFTRLHQHDDEVIFDVAAEEGEEAEEYELHSNREQSTTSSSRHPDGALPMPSRESTWSFNLPTDLPRHRESFNPQTIQSPLKRELYLLLEDPSSSQAAFWVNIFVSVAIVSSALMTTLETIPSFRSKESYVVWFNLETVMVLLFTIEYMLRFIAHSDNLGMLARFFVAPLSLIDFISILPYYIELIAQRDTTYEFRFTILRLFRLLRLFKSFKYSNTIVMTIEVMMAALKRSGDALSALFFFMVTSVVLFSTLLYFAERGTWDDQLGVFVTTNGVPSAFDSIPSTFWFVLVTITTTGYGDMVPTTFIGKLVTFPAMMFGVLLIALPSIIVGRNFTTVWEQMKHAEGGRSVRADSISSTQAPHVRGLQSVPGDASEQIIALQEQLKELLILTTQNQRAIEQIVAHLNIQA